MKFGALKNMSLLLINVEADCRVLKLSVMTSNCYFHFISMTLSKICAEGKRRKEGGRVNVKIQGKHGKEESPEYFLFLFNDKGFLNSE